MGKNKNLTNAKIVKNDEFYTLEDDIKKECMEYRADFIGKTIYCNCDNPAVSNFFKFFACKFNTLGLKKLICTCKDSQEHTLWWWDAVKKNIIDGSHAYKITLPTIIDMNGDGKINDEDIYLMIKQDIETKQFKYVERLEGDGDFRSPECVEILKEADVVVTNPPFSLFREFVNIIKKYDKKFLIIGNKNALTYKEIFSLVMDDEIWLGYNSVKSFLRPDGLLQNFGNIGWFTNLDVCKRHEKLVLRCEYEETKYLKYDNYDAIEVSRVEDIPCDYEGIMGVPISFLDKYNPEQFEIVGGSMFDDTSCRIEKHYIEDGYTFLKSNGKDISTSGALRDRMSPKITGRGTSDFSVSPDGKYLHSIYQRIFIRNKNPQPFDLHRD